MDAFRHARRPVGGLLRSGVRRNGGRAHALAGAVAALVASVEATRLAAPPTAAGRRPPVVVAFPGPEWAYASPRTRITFSGASPGAVSVTGSASGPIPGAVHPLRRRPGAVFTPSRRFQPGERVTVTTQNRVLGAGGPAFSFTIAQFADPPFLKVDLSAAARIAPAQGSPPIGACRPRRRRFRTLPELRPAGWCLSRPRADQTARGHILVTPRSHPERRRGDQHGVMILSGSGRLLWYSPRPFVARDLKTVTYRGKRLLAFYEWAPRRRSAYVLLDRRYREVMRIRARHGYLTNTHELQLTRRGTAYVAAYQPVWHAELGRLVTDFVIQEIDLTSRDVLFEWHSLDHVPPSASYQPPPDPRYSWDYFHGNSIQPPDDRGTIVVSARNTSAVYGIDRRTGRLRWTLGGRLDQFGLPPEARFCAQHDARPAPGGRLTVFDDGGLALGDMRDCGLHRARVQTFRLDPRRRRAHLVRTIQSQPSSDDGSGLYVWAMGSARRQPNRNMLIDWGTAGRITEVTPRGEVVFGLQLEYYSYRAVRSPWWGRPIGPPAVAAERVGRRAVRVWASWNGATEVVRWRVLAGRSPDAVRRAGVARVAGLETEIHVPAPARYVRVEALDAGGRVLARSPAVPVG